MSPFSSYGLLVLSLGSLFAAGGAVGYFVGKGAVPPLAGSEAVIGTAPGSSPQQWAEQAFTSLDAELQLNEVQQSKIRPYLMTAAERVFTERDRALLQMHLRLLEVHDLLAREGALDALQRKRLAASRAKLKASILSRFAGILQSESGSVPDL